MTQKFIQDKRHGRLAVTDHVFHLKDIDMISTSDQGNDEWLFKRRNFITASAIAPIVNKCPFTSRDELLQKKVGIVTENKAYHVAINHGHKYELEAIIKYEKLRNEQVISFGLLQSLNPDEEFIAGSPDGITATGRLIEVKSPYARTPTDEVPEYYMFQIQTLMHTLRIPVCDFIQYIPEGEWQAEMLLITTVDYDPNFWKELFPSIVSFWNEICTIKSKMDETGELPEGLGFGKLKRIKEDEEPPQPEEKKQKKIQVDITPCYIELDEQKVLLELGRREARAKASTELNW